MEGKCKVQNAKGQPAGEGINSTRAHATASQGNGFIQRSANSTRLKFNTTPEFLADGVE
jgi:hypothetical protein